MKKTVLLTMAALTCAAWAAVDVDRDVWFLADFDKPARMNGDAAFFDLADSGYVEGRFGKGYYFSRATSNKLKPMAQFLAGASNFIGKDVKVEGETLSFGGGEFQVAAQPSGAGYNYVWREVGCTWSVFVKGPKGGEVTLWAELTPLGADSLKKVTKQYPDYPKKHVADLAVTNVVKLTGDWQRIEAYVVSDNRAIAHRKTSLRLNSTSPLKMQRFQLQPTGVYPYRNNYAAGIWVDGGKKANDKFLRCADAEVLKTFPFKAGACAFWMKNAVEAHSNSEVRVWSMSRPWSTQWGFDSGSFYAGEKGSCLRFKRRIPRRDEWTHVACTWRDGRIAYFVNGELQDELVPDEKKKIAAVKCMPQTGNFGTLRIGGCNDGSIAIDAVVDDFAIFNRALDDAEIRELANAKCGLAEGEAKVLAENILFRTFFRDQEDARLRFKVFSPKAAEYELTMTVGGVKGESRTVALPAGASYLDVPFEPALFRPGKYPFEFTLTTKGGAVALKRTGELDIRGRLGKNPFIFNSWGGMAYIHPEFLRRLGVNSYNIGSGDKLQIRKSLNAGMFANLRYENGNEWFNRDFDMAAIRAKTVSDLEFAAALPNWRTTLLNSEIYGSGVAKRAQNNPKYLAMVERATGVKPDFTFGDAPSEVNFKKLGVSPARGEIDHLTYPTLETLNYVVGKGLPPIISNYETTKAIHSVKPGMLVWSEPMWGDVADSVDMGADWEYEYSTLTTLRQLRAHYADCRRLKKPYMPTLGAGYWPELKGRHPSLVDKNGKPEVVNMGQGTDEVTIKTWLSIGAIPAHNLSWFGLDCWEYGVTNAAMYVISPTNAAAQTAWGKCIAEPDSAERYGRRWRTDLKPAAELLRDLPNVRAKIAYLSLPEIASAAGFWWGIAHYPNTIAGTMVKSPAAFDYVGRDELLSGEIEKYEYVVYPMSRVVYKEHAEALRKAAKAGVKIVLDSYATNRYENCVYLKDLSYTPGRWGRMGEVLNAWYTNVAEEVASRESARSPATDGKSSFTFEKAYKGVRYVVVVNDLRDSKPSFLNLFRTNESYRVVGAQQTIVTKIRQVDKDAKVYLFNARKRDRELERNGDELTLTGEFAPAEGCVYCVYPKALEAPELSFEGEAMAGKTATLVVKISDEDGKPAPGRQIVVLRLTDSEGKVRDESGNYTVEDGVVRIPLRIPHDEPATGLFSKWKAQVVDLTTGKTGSLRLSIQ